MASFDKVKPLGDNGEIAVVVETPRGSTLKYRHEPALDVFGVSRELPAGLAYPFDWGFVPGTMAEDGDPLDALAISDVSSFPGVLHWCRALGVIDVDQKNEHGKRISNPRLIVMPVWHERGKEIDSHLDLPKQLRAEIEKFFLDAIHFTPKDAKIKGWRGKDEALKLVQSHIRK